MSPMAMGKRKRQAEQASMWVATQDLPRSAAHLDTHDFDEYVEGVCQRFYAEEGRPGLPPRALLSASADRLFRGLGRGARDRGSPRRDDRSRGLTARVLRFLSAKNFSSTSSMP